MYLIERDSNNDILQSYAIYEERGIQLEKLMNLQKKKKKGSPHETITIFFLIFY